MNANYINIQKKTRIKYTKTLGIVLFGLLFSWTISGVAIGNDRVDSLAPYMKQVSLGDFYRITLNIKLKHHSTPIKFLLYLIPAKNKKLNKLTECGLTRNSLKHQRLYYGILVKRVLDHPFKSLKRKKIWKRARLSARHPHQSDYQIAKQVYEGIGRNYVMTLNNKMAYINLLPSSWCDSGALILEGRFKQNGFSGRIVVDSFSRKAIGYFKAVPMYSWMNNDNNRAPNSKQRSDKALMPKDNRHGK
jgi:hypothetical protein